MSRLLRVIVFYSEPVICLPSRSDIHDLVFYDPLQRWGLIEGLAKTDRINRDREGANRDVWKRRLKIRRNSKIIPNLGGLSALTSPRKMKLNRTLLLLFAGAGMLPPLIFRAIAWYHGGPMASWPSFGKTMLISVITTVAISCGVVSVMIWLQKAHPWRE
ncbi:MAG: hypothetical protein KDC32_23840, partial [Saprospiraceae bacterium]|nr:hypothetical protein [Saprospiraceae bacterium]